MKIYLIYQVRRDTNIHVIFVPNNLMYNRESISGFSIIRMVYIIVTSG